MIVFCPVCDCSVTCHLDDCPERTTPVAEIVDCLISSEEESLAGLSEILDAVSRRKPVGN